MSLAPFAHNATTAPAFGTTPDDDDGGWGKRYVPGRGKGSLSRTSSPRASLDAGPGLRLRMRLTKSTKSRSSSPGTRFINDFFRNRETWSVGTRDWQLFNSPPNRFSRTTSTYNLLTYCDSLIQSSTATSRQRILLSAHNHLYSPYLWPDSCQALSRSFKSLYRLKNFLCLKGVGQRAFKSMFNLGCLRKHCPAILTP